MKNSLKYTFFWMILSTLISCQSRYINNWSFITKKKNCRVFNTMENRTLVCLDSSCFNSNVNFDKIKKVHYLNGSFNIKYQVNVRNEKSEICVKLSNIYFRNGITMRKKIYYKLAPDLTDEGLIKIKSLLNTDWKMQ